MNYTNIEKHILRIKQLVPGGQDSKEYITNVLHSLMEGDSPVSMGIVSLSNSEDPRRLTSSLLTAENIDNPEKVLQRPEGIVDLYTIEWILRPALLLNNNKFDKLEKGIWENLKEDIMESECRSVCRIDLSHLGHLGTGFICGENSTHYFLLTNAHVIEGALMNYWTKSNSIKLKCSFDLEYKNASPSYNVLDEKYFIHESHDLGILYLSKNIYDIEPNILKINTAQPSELNNLKICVIGHPSFNTNKDPFPKIFGFGEYFGVKRLSLGFTREINNRKWRSSDVPVLFHDATTLSGSSGSCIIDLDTKKVLGLHFGGWPNMSKSINTNAGDVMATLFESNGGVPLWKIQNDNTIENLNYD